MPTLQDVNLHFPGTPVPSRDVAVSPDPGIYSKSWAEIDPTSWSLLALFNVADEELILRVGRNGSAAPFLLFMMLAFLVASLIQGSLHR